MKKYNRQRMILDLIAQHEIKTQEELSEYLLKRGVKATQATISRDIKELRISKVQNESGECRYTLLDAVHDSLNERLQKIFRSSVLSVHRAGDLIIVQTIAYTATVCGLYITNHKLDGIAGIITGHDTIFIAVEKPEMVERLLDEIQRLMR